MTAQSTIPPRGTPRVMLTAEEGAEQLGIGRTTMFALLKTGELKSVKVGRLRRIPLDEIQAYANRLMVEQRSADAIEGN